MCNVIGFIIMKYTESRVVTWKYIGCIYIHVDNLNKN